MTTMTEMFPPDATLEVMPEETNPAKERHIYNRSNWLPGPWTAEPFDKVHWIDPSTDMDCMIIRGGMGAWCGYVAVTEGHPLFERGYSDDAANVNVHGGLTFADKCHEGGRICHVPRPGRAEHVWWLGFDCNRSGDLAPGMISLDRHMAVKDGTPGLWTKHQEYDAETGTIHRGTDYTWDETYRTAAYVKAEVESLARQLKEMGIKG